MRFLFLTNQASYHQMHFARAMAVQLGEENFRIVFQKPTSADRAEMGWKDDYSEPYILRYWEQAEQVLRWISDADVVIQGRFPTKLVKPRIKAGKLTFACQERLWKKKPTLGRKLSRLGHFWKNYISVNDPNYHFLAIGAFAARDLNDLGFFRDRSWRFGYFIDCPEYSPRPPREHIELLWCARLIEVKQPLLALELVQGLIAQGIDCRLTMIGDGPLRAVLEDSIAQRNLGEQVRLTGWQTQHEVRQAMQAADLFVMTSHHGEGWGLVVNEALSYGCGVIASEELGSAVWMVQEGESGFLFNQKTFCDLPGKLASLGRSGVLKLGEVGQASMQRGWSADIAAQRVVRLSQTLLSDDDTQHSPNKSKAKQLYLEGPCSFIEPA